MITGRSAFISLLKDEGVTHLFGNPGTTELPIMHALTDHPDLTYVLGLQESIVVAMADGYTRASGKLTACNVHVAPGLGNAIGSIYNAKFAGTPMIITAGQQEQGHGLTEPLLYAPLVPIAEPVVKWAVEVNRLEDLPRIVHRAAKVAMTPPTGPVFISLPGDILNAEAGIELGSGTRIDAASRPSDDALDALAARLLAAERPALICGPELVTADALGEAARLAEVLGAPAYQQTVPYGAHFLSEHPAFMGALTRDQRQVRDTLAPYDLLVCIGGDVLRMSVWSETDPLPEGMPMVQLGNDDWEIGKNYPVEMAVRGDVGVTLQALLPVLEAKGGAARATRAKVALGALAETNWTASRAALAANVESEASTQPINPDWLMLQIADAMPEDGIVVDEGIMTSASLLKFLPFRDRYSYFGLASGGIGWGVAGAVGVQLAHPDRRVLALSGDGSAMYSIQAIWSAAHQKLPITYVIANNGGYRIIKQRLLSFHGNDQFIGMDFEDPPIDFTGLATSFGLSARRVTDPADVTPALQEALANDGPNLIEIIVEGGVKR
jgi:benzoylformate decarboxylase